MKTDKAQHGGKREGAGRKPTAKEPTTIIRVPVSVAEKIKHGILNDVTESSNQQSQIDPKQTWCFSFDELQEQARLIERLTAENQRLTAELQIANRKTTPENQEKMATLEQKLNQAEHEAREISKKWHLEQKKARKLADEKEFMQEKTIFLLSEIATLKELKDKRGFVSNAKNAREKSFLNRAELFE